MRLVVTLFPLLFAPSLAMSQDKPTPVSKPQREFLDAHCVSCHTGDAPKGGLNLETINASYRDPATFAAWVKVHDRLVAGDMPPRDRKKRPTDAEVEPLVNNLKGALTGADMATRAGAGRTVFRRLNRNEYENTLRDLFSIPGLKVKDLLPEDGRAHGYDKSGTALDLSHVQLAKYMEAADVALDAATMAHAARPTVYKDRIYPGHCYDFMNVLTNGDAVPLRDMKLNKSLFEMPTDWSNQPKLGDLLKEKKFPYDGSVGVFRHEDCAFRPRMTPFLANYAGRYKLRLSVWSFIWNKGEVKPSPRTESASLIAGGRTLGYFDAPSLKPTVHEIEVWLNLGDEINFNAASLWPTRVSEKKGKATEYVGPGIGIDWLDIEGPIIDDWPPPGHKRLWGNLPLAPAPQNPDAADPRFPKRKPIRTIGNTPIGPITYGTVASATPLTDAHQLISGFLPKAFRRVVTREEIDRFVNLFKSQTAEGAGFESAMRTVYKTILCSPEFLYLKEPAGRLNHWAIASRMSYFLWNSMPDDELFEHAYRNRLHDRAILREQVERMLRDPKSERFILDFCDQWLDLREIDATCPDRRLYPEFQPILHDAIIAETQAFFREMVEKDLSVSNIVDSDFTILNQRLAEHYRIPDVVGSALRRVSLPADSDRGGLLTQASILKVTANGTVTSPVKRGAWVQRKILGQPPEPPPPDIPTIEPDVRGAITVRDLLAKHRSNATCASCHNKIDPPGFALESYDVIGGFQNRYRVIGNGDVPPPESTGGREVGYRLGLNVDAAGETPDGRPFTEMESYRKLLLADIRPLARNLTEQMLTYSTGSPPSFADRPGVDQILDKAKNYRYGTRSLIHEIVQSMVFQTK